MAQFINERFQGFPIITLVIALTCHALFFSVISIHIPTIPIEKKTEIAFLGAILYSFEVGKVDSEKTNRPDVDKILSRLNSSTGKSITSIDKPNFTKWVNIKPKIFIKSEPRRERTIEKTIPVTPAATSVTTEKPQPYERLRLYR